MAIDLKQLEGMTLKELETANQQLTAQRAAIREQQLLLVAEIDKRVALIKAESKLRSFTADEKAAMAQVLKAKGIQSADDSKS